MAVTITPASDVQLGDQVYRPRTIASKLIEADQITLTFDDGTVETYAPTDGIPVGDPADPPPS